MEIFKRCFGGSNRRLSEDTVAKSNRLRPFPRPSLCEDIYTEILLRLPVKSVVKFRSVSKLWFSIVSSRRFRQSHACRHRASAATALHFKECESDFVLPLNNGGPVTTKAFHLGFPEKQYSGESRPQYVVSSCNGLLLLTSDDRTYYVYNPTTKECSKALEIPRRVTNNKYVCASLAFDPSESLHYRVVFLLCQQPYERRYDSKLQLEVYSSAKGECKSPASNTIVGSFDYKHNRGVFCNGAIHWLPVNPISVIYFNVHTECLKEIRTPGGSGTIHYFGESHGHVHLVKSDDCFYFYHSSFLHVFELKSDYSGWFLKCEVELASITSTLPTVDLHEFPGNFVSVICDDEEDETMLLLWIRNWWVEYNLKKKTMKRVCEYMQPLHHGSLLLWPFWSNTYQIISTLICIN